MRKGQKGTGIFCSATLLILHVKLKNAIFQIPPLTRAHLEPSLPAPCCIHNEMLTKALRSGPWSWEAGVSQLITGRRKKHPRALTARLCMSHQCPLRKAGTGDVSVQKPLCTQKKNRVWGQGRSSTASGDISERNERFNFELSRRLKAKRPCLTVQLPTRD